MQTHKEWLSTKEVSEYFDGSLKPGTLEIMRVQGRGPRFVKFGRAVRYRRADLDAWAEAQARQNTSE